MNLENYGSFGRYPKQKPEQVIPVFWKDEIPDLESISTTILPYGLGKSYGDSCLNQGGTLIDMKGLNRFISFDSENGIIRCEAGVTLAEILDFAVHRGWFLSATPGTKFITVGGAIANDVHGKNHHKSGTFGCHVIQFELLRSNGEKKICSKTENPELFSATIGGLGLTGIILWAEFKLRKCQSAYFDMESIKFGSLEEFFEINKESEHNFDYTVSWVDTTSSGGSLGRGIFNRGNHSEIPAKDLPPQKPQKLLPFPFDAPFINHASVLAFNTLYYQKQIEKIQKVTVHYDPFFYPLDAVNNWNRAYGKNGFLQYQFVIPFGNELRVIKQILTHVARSGMSSFLTVLKTFGSMKSPGMLSFPRPGVTMAIDFRYNGQKTLDFLTELDNYVREAGGILYPAKDARMTAEDFQMFYPNWIDFSKYIDPKFSSSFWRRVTH